MIQINLQLFSDSIAQTVPESLQIIEQQNSWLIGVLLGVSFLLIALSRRVETTVLIDYSRIFFSQNSTTDITKRDFNVNSLASIFMVVNFVITFWLCVVLLTQSILEVPYTDVYLVCAIVTFLFLIHQFAGFALTSWITGEAQYFKEVSFQSLISVGFLGLLFFGIALIWFLNPQLRIELFYIFIFTLLTYLFVRLLKGAVISLRLGAPWYYIILYFCTLEILPLFVAYYYLEQNFIE